MRERRGKSDIHAEVRLSPPASPASDFGQSPMLRVEENLIKVVDIAERSA